MILDSDDGANTLCWFITCLFLNSMCQVLVMADAANKFKREKLDPSIVKILRKNSKVKSVLVLNKVKCDPHFYSF